MSLEFKHKEKDVIYFDDLDWKEQVKDIQNTYGVISKKVGNESNNLESVFEYNDEINKTFKSVCDSMVSLIRYFMEVNKLPVLIVYTNEKLDLEIKCYKNLHSLSEPVVEFSRKLSLKYDKEENCISFIYPSDFDSEQGSRTPKYIENLTYPVRDGVGIVGGQFNNDNVVRIIKRFILGIEEEAKHY